MAVRTPIDQAEGLYFITFTCCDWLPLFEITDGYDAVYKWFDYLKSKNHFVKGYVIVPNHIHLLIDFSASSKSINTIVSNGKRFMAYELVKRLERQKNNIVLHKLQESVTASDKDRGKNHQVFERSFDCKLITTEHFFLQKLNYIHNNPCSGVWNLVKNLLYETFFFDTIC
jgi:REP element-mobilizing transposase RayT